MGRIATTLSKDTATGILMMSNKIINVRSTMAPMMPIINRRFWKAAGTAKYVKIIKNTKMLSTARLFSMR